MGRLIRRGGAIAALVSVVTIWPVSTGGAHAAGSLATSVLPAGWVETVAGRRAESADGLTIDPTSLGAFAEQAVDVTDQGDVFFSARDQIFRVDASRTLHRVAGTGVPIDVGESDGSGAVHARDVGFQNIRRLTVSPDGGLTVIEVPRITASGPEPTQVRTIRVRVIDPAGIIRSQDISVTGCPAVPDAVPRQGTCYVWDALVGADGSVYERFSAKPGIYMLAVRRPGQRDFVHFGGNGHPTADEPATSGRWSGEAATNVPLDVDLDSLVGDGDGNVFLVSGGRVEMITLDGKIYWLYGEPGGSKADGAAARSADLGCPSGLRRDASNSFLIPSTDCGGEGDVRIRRIDNRTSIVADVAGGGSSVDDGVPPTAALLAATTALAVSPDGSTVSAVTTLPTPDNGPRRVIRSFRLGGAIRTVVGSPPTADYLARWKGRGSRVPRSPGIGISPDGSAAYTLVNEGGAVVPARLDLVHGGSATPLAFAFGWTAITADSAGTVYLGRNDNLSAGVTIVAPDSATTNVEVARGDALLDALAVDSTGRILVAVGPQLLRLERSGTGWRQSVLSDGLDGATGLAAGVDGSVYVAEPGRSRVRRYAPGTGLVPFAGVGSDLNYGFGGDEHPAVDAKLARPTDVAVGPDGSVFIVDCNGTRLREVTVDGIIHTVAGNGTFTNDVDRGPAVDAVFTAPLAVAVDAAGFVFVLDGGSGTIRRVLPSPDTSPGQAARFVPVPPTRLLDTRDESDAPMSAGSSRTLRIGGTVHGSVVVPNEANAVVLNVTVTEALGPGYVQVLPAGRATVGSASTLNLAAPSDTRANITTVPLGDDLSVTVYVQAGGHLILDLAGYYLPTRAASADGRFVGFSPERVLDTRAPGGGSSGKPGPADTVRVRIAGRGSVPVRGVAAVVVNVTGTEASAPGYVQAMPDDGSVTPGRSSTLNLTQSGDTTANLAIVPLDGRDSVVLYTQSGTHLVLDVVGYYTDATAEFSTAGLFVAAPASLRRLDTRGQDDTGRPRPPLAAGGTVTVDVAYGSANVRAVVANLTATEAMAPGYVQALPTGSGTIGSSSSLNVSRAGQTLANAVQIVIGERGLVTLFTQAGTHLIFDVSGWFTAT